MRAVVQVVSGAKVTVDGAVVGEIADGLLIYLGISRDDTEDDARWLAGKIAKQRLVNDQPPSQTLVVSQFTLHASTKKGAKPSFHRAAPAEQALPLYEFFLNELRKTVGTAPQTGIFGAWMLVESVNNGPMTLILDSKTRD